MNLFGFHRNEAASALRIQDWKGFLRLRIGRNGSLKIHFIGFRKVPRKWRMETLANGAPIAHPVDEIRGEIVDHITIGPQQQV
jgi:hypothetical protein